jgi:hypothetical protein
MQDANVQFPLTNWKAGTQLYNNLTTVSVEFSNIGACTEV